jgi:hypothetical protein
MSSINPSNSSNNGQVNEQAARSEGSSRGLAASDNLRRRVGFSNVQAIPNNLHNSDNVIGAILDRRLAELAEQRARAISAAEEREFTERLISVERNSRASQETIRNIGETIRNMAEVMGETDRRNPAARLPISRLREERRAKTAEFERQKEEIMTGLIERGIQKPFPNARIFSSSSSSSVKELPSHLIPKKRNLRNKDTGVPPQATIKRAHRVNEVIQMSQRDFFLNLKRPIQGGQELIGLEGGLYSPPILFLLKE